MSPYKAIVLESGRAFAAGFGLKAVLALLLHALKVARSKGGLRMMSTKELVEEAAAARQWGLFLGLLNGIYNSSVHVLTKVLTVPTARSWSPAEEADKGALTTQRVPLQLPGGAATSSPSRFFLSPEAVAGALAGLSLFCLPPDTRRTLALYAAVRGGQAYVNSAVKSKALPAIPHFQSLLFMLGSAQVMYAYVMRPNTLPSSYNKFIVTTGPIAPEVLGAVRANGFGRPFNMEVLKAFVSKVAAPNAVPQLTQDVLPIIGCDVLHSQCPSCVTHNGRVFLSTMKKTVPVYAAVFFGTLLTFRIKKLLSEPTKAVLDSGLGMVRSSVFLSSFVTLYMAIVCVHRKVAIMDNPYIYWLAGFLCSIVIFIERESRRLELALYVLPRAVDSFFMAAVDRKLVKPLPCGEVVLFSAALGLIMHYFVREKDCLVSFLTSGIGHVFPTIDERRKELGLVSEGLASTKKRGLEGGEKGGVKDE